MRADMIAERHVLKSEQVEIKERKAVARESLPFPMAMAPLMLVPVPTVKSIVIKRVREMLQCFNTDCTFVFAPIRIAVT